MDFQTVLMPLLHGSTSYQHRSTSCGRQTDPVGLEPLQPFFCTVEIGALQLIKLKDPEADAFIRYSITGDDSNR